MIVNCEHARPAPRKGFVHCALGAVNGPSVGVCMLVCRQRSAVGPDDPHWRENYLTSLHQPPPIPGAPKMSFEQRRDTCRANRCGAFGGLEETVSGFEADGPEMVRCSACSCPMKRVHLRKGICPKGLFR